MNTSKRSMRSGATPTSAQFEQSTAVITKLESVEKGIKYFLCGIAVLSLIAYSCVVYTQDQWKVNHRQLRKLQTQESQQAIINARLRDAEAQNAEKTQNGLVTPQPDQVLYVPANTQKSLVASPAPIDQPSVLPGPVGY
jgi:hypothetical protein